jgi:hypothetical protein
VIFLLDSHLSSIILLDDDNFLFGPFYVQKEYHIIWTNARDLNNTVLNYVQSLLEAYNESVDSGYNSIPI